MLIQGYDWSTGYLLNIDQSRSDIWSLFQERKSPRSFPILLHIHPELFWYLFGEYVQRTYLESGFYPQITSRQISEKSNCTHTRNVKRGHRESSKGIKIRSRCCNIYLMHRYVYKQKQERREGVRGAKGIRDRFFFFVHHS